VELIKKQGKTDVEGWMVIFLLVLLTILADYLDFISDETH